MRSFWIILLFYLPIILRADWDQLFSDGEDPTIFHHVNVITGNLNLSFNDTMKTSGIDIPLFRTYSSAGALERTDENFDLILKRYRKGWSFQGGWSLMPHVSLIFEFASNLEKTIAYISEPGGNFVSYQFSHKGDGYIYFKPSRGGQSHGEISGAHNIENNLLRFEKKKETAILFLPNGGKRVYYDCCINEKNAGQKYRGKRLYLLYQEILPNQHVLEYQYDKKKNLTQVIAFDPNKRRQYSFVKFDFGHANHTLNHLEARTSKGQLVEYHFEHHWKRDYLNGTKNKNLLDDTSSYEPSRKGSGVRINKLSLANKMQFELSYYRPPDKKYERIWAKNPEQKDFHIDKVKTITAPVGEKGQMENIASFSYFPNLTEVKDVDDLLIRYHHDDGKLTCIQYHDDQNQVYSSQVFYWDKNRLKCKAKLDKKGAALFAKTFDYDANGNVTEEVLWGNLSGRSEPLFIDKNGNPSGAECFRKKYSYDPHFNVVTKEEEDELTYRYFYKPNTNLLTAKITLNNNEILKREFHLYSDENFLIREMIDDGCGSFDANDLTGITQRLEKSYTIDPNTALVTSICEWYTDDDGNLQPLKKKELRYSNQQRIIEERIFDAKDNYCTSIHIDYDSYGNITKKTTPTGEENFYSYDDLGNLILSKEVGSPTQRFTYNAMNLQTSCTTEESGKTSYTFYDAKARVIKEVDGRGNITCHSYDCFGNKLSTKYPPIAGSDKNLYDPIAKFQYDIHGNLISSTLPQGERSFQFYNTYRKPIKILQADGSKIQHDYNLNGTLAQTIQANGNTIHYEYDPLQRPISKKIYSGSELISSETWTYNTFHLLSYTDNNVVTTYEYDRAGRKISETVGNRKIHYEYDDLGFIKCVKKGPISFITIRDFSGKVTDQWEEDDYGHIKNKMSFFYNGQNRKEKAVRSTSAGDAVDLFEYDFLGRLICHTDPNQAATKIIYNDDFENEFGQKVLQKITIDPLQNRLIETQDAGRRIISIERQDPQGITVFKEEYVYDRSGNKIERISYVFADQEITKVISFQMEYDCMGRVIKEIEVNEKVTTYDYNVDHQVIKKVLPNKVSLHYKYDPLGRLLELKSSDHSIHYHYTYDHGTEPIEIKDLLQKTSLKRKYNIYGEVIEETSATGLKYSWEYDNLGRCLSFHLPDGSSISYAYLGMYMSAVIRKNSNTVYSH